MITKLHQNKNVIGIMVLAVFLVLLIIYLIKRNTEFTDNAYLKSDIIILKPKVTGYIKQIFVNDNQAIKKGDIIAKIDDGDYQSKLKLARANVESAAIKIEALNEKIAIQEIEINNSGLKENSVKNSLDVADKELKRAEFLIKDKTISQLDLDKKREAQKNLNNEYHTAQANTNAAISQKDILNLELKQAEAELDKDQANLELAQNDLDNTVIKAADDGVVNIKSLQVGQLATSNLALGYLITNNIWVIANFKETQIGKMKSGQEAIVEVDSINGKKFKAKVDSFSPATGAELSILPPENATGNFTKIVQRIPVKIIFNPNQDLSNLKTGMSCEVKVHTRL